MQTLLLDIRYALRSLGKSPGFTAISILTLALGIGANTGIFSILRQVLLQRLPVTKPQELVLLYSYGPRRGHIHSDEGGGEESFSYPVYKDLRDHNSVFTDLAAHFSAPASIAHQGQTERADADLVSGNFFETLGVRAAIGRIFSNEDSAVAGGNPVIVLGYGYWMRRFGANPAILNQSVLINYLPMTVVGVAPRGFDGIQVGRVPDVYIPITMKAQITPNRNGLEDRKDYWAILLGRVKPGISREQAEAGINAAYRPILENDLPLQGGMSDQEKRQFVASHISLHDGSKGRPLFQNDTKEPLAALMAMVGLVLFIACANVAGLLTARGVARQKEITVRLSLGARRWRLVRQLLVEACVLSSAAGLLGLVMAAWTAEGLIRFAGENLEARGLSSALDLPVLLFALSLALVCGCLFGIVPALRATRVELSSTLKDQAGSISSGLAHARLRKGLVISQVALTLLLVTAAAGFARSLYNVQHAALGLRPSHVLQFAVAPQLNGYDAQHAFAFFRQLEDRLAILPGVQSAAAAQIPVLAGDTRGSNVHVEGEPPEQAGTIHIFMNAIGPAYFSTMGIPLIRGREFTRQDAENAPKVAIINESMARKFFGDREAIGRHLAFAGGKAPLNIEIVGLVKDSKHLGVKEQVQPFAYVPYTQDSDRRNALTYYVRTQQNPELLADSVRKTVQALDASMPVFEMRTFESQIERSIASERLLGFLAVAFGALAAILAALGIYALLAYTVAQRTREMGVRMALGAGPRQLRAMIVMHIGKLVGVGMLIGLPMAYGMSRLTQSLLYQVKAFDLFSFTVALIALSLIAIIAGYAPARRATRIDPVTALRYE